VHPELLPMVARAMKPGGIWRIASDDPTYQDWVRDCMGAQAFFTLESLAETRPSGWPPTRYEAKALREGRQPLYWEWVRVAQGALANAQ
jgi:tRNA (guanine-N7-)-methyltransferase